MGSPGALGKQVQIMRVSRGWEDRVSPGALREQVHVMRVSKGLGGQGVPLVLWGNRYSL